MALNFIKKPEQEATQEAAPQQQAAPPAQSPAPAPEAAPAPAPAPAPAAETAPKTGPDDDEISYYDDDNDDEKSDDTSNILRDRITDMLPENLANNVNAHFKAYVKGALSLAGVAIVGIISYIGFSIYISSLLSLGIENIHEKNYRGAVTYLKRYVDYEGLNEKSALWLGRAYIFSGQEEQAKGPLAQFTANPEIAYMHALSFYPSSPDEATTKLSGVANEASIDGQQPYAQTALGIVALINGEYTEADFRLKSAAPLIDTALQENDPVINEQLASLYRFYLRYNSKVPEQRAVLPFDQPDVPLNETFIRLGFNMGLDGFDPLFVLRLTPNIAAYDLKNTPLNKIFTGLNLLAIAQENTLPENIRIAIASYTRDRKNSSLMSQYIAGYYQIKLEDFAAAAQTYAYINSVAETGYSRSYQTASEWLDDGGGKQPDEVIINSYKRAVELIPENVTALNNLAFMQLYADDLEGATESIKKASALNSLSPRVIVNRTAIDLALQLDGGSVYGEEGNTAGSLSAQMLGIVNAFPRSSYIRNIAARVELLAGNFSDGIDYAVSILEQDPAPAVALFIAETYRQYGKQGLAADILKRGLELFPGNKIIVRALIVEEARGGDAQAVENLITTYKIPESAAESIYALALLVEQENLEESTEIVLEAFRRAPPKGRLAINIMLEATRQFLLLENYPRAKTAYNTAQNLYKERNSVIYGLDLGLKALGLRVHSSSGEQTEIDPVRELLLQAQKVQNFSAQTDLGHALVALAQHQEAIDAFNATRTEINPDATARVLASYLRGIATAQEKLGNKKEAKSARQRLELVLAGSNNTDSSQTIDPEAITNVVFKGSSSEFFSELNKAVASADYQQAIDLYTQLIEDETLRNSTNASKPALTHHNRGALYMSIKRYDLAAKDFEKAFSLLAAGEPLTTTENETLLYNSAYSLFQIKQHARAESNLRKLLPDGKPPNIYTYQNLLARVLFEQESYKEAGDIYQLLVDSQPQNVGHYLSLSNVHIRNQENPEAINVLNKALEISPNNIKVHLKLSELYRKAGEVEKAARHANVVRNLRTSQ